MKKKVRICDECKQRIANHKCYLCGKDLCDGCVHKLSLAIDKYEASRYSEEKNLIFGVDDLGTESVYKKPICSACHGEIVRMIRSLADEEIDHEELVNRLLNEIKDFITVEKL